MVSGAGPSVCLLAVGAKGFGLALDLAASGDAFRPSIVATYAPRGTREPGPDRFRAGLEPLGVEVREGSRPDLRRWIEDDGIDLVLYAGWQHLTPDIGAVPEVVLHDSLLPRLRGFNPTVTALIEGHDQLGVTAFLKVDEVDAGPILSQHAIGIRPPVTIAAALEAIRPCYAAAAMDAITAFGRGPTGSGSNGREQDHARATYSIWRDEDDYRLDLTGDADRVVRTVMALGDPYLGASAVLSGRRVRILAARPRPEVPFERRDPGKVWRLEDDGPVVVCGSGMVQFTRIVDDEGREVVVDRLRTRFT
jgi:methionyl-tRNA formyltransferase